MKENMSIFKKRYKIRSINKFTTKKVLTYEIIHNVLKKFLQDIFYQIDYYALKRSCSIFFDGVKLMI